LDFVEKMPGKKYTLIVHPGARMNEGQYELKLTPNSLRGFAVGLYSLEGPSGAEGPIGTDGPDSQFLELYDSNGIRIDWEKKSKGTKTLSGIVREGNERFERIKEEIFHHIKLPSAVRIDFTHHFILAHYDGEDFLAGLEMAFEMAGLDPEDYLRLE
jgi:hypothetical protein